MPVSPSDADLVGAALTGSSRAFDELMDRYWRSARAVAYQSTRSWSDADDAVQEAFILAFRKLRSLRSPERFGGWLFTIVQRCCVEAARGRARRPVPIPEVEVMTDAHEPPEDAKHEQRELREQIMSAIEDLPERYRPVVILRYGQAMAVKDIGRSLGLPVGTVVSQMFRANRILRDRLRHLVS